LLPRQARIAICGTLWSEPPCVSEWVLLNWLRVKDSNLDLLVQSQPSCRLDEPEMFV
jgi:hypothetical protein